MNIKKLFIYAICLVMTITLVPDMANAATTAKVIGAKAPSVLVKGDGYEIEGLTEDVRKIKSLRVGICSPDGNWLGGHNVTVKPNTMTYRLSKVSGKMHFDKLKTGSYIFKVYLTDSKAAKTIYTKKFTVRTAFNASDIGYEDIVILGKDSKVSGKVTSYYKLTKVNAGIADSKGTKWIDKYTYTPKKTTFDLTSLNNDINFSKLKEGTYTLWVYCYDSKGHKGTVVKKQFKVKKPFEGENISFSRLMVKGEDTAVSGKIISIYKMTKIKYGIYDEDNKKWHSYKWYYPKSTSFNLKTAGEDLKFSELKIGKYSLRAYAYDDNGNKGYAIKDVFEISKPFTLENHNYPSVLSTGNDKTLKGKITSVHELKTVKVGVLKSGKWVVSKSINPKGNSFDIADVNSSFTFAKLTAGRYTYRIYAEDTKGHEENLLSKSFKVVKPTFTISDNYTYPSLLTKGSGFYLIGNVYSDVSIDYVRVGICDEDGTWLSGFNTKKNLNGEKIFYISTVDSTISFGNLDTGNYYYKVYAKDKAGAYKTLVKKKFYVMNPFTMEKDMTVSDMSSAMYDKINDDEVFLGQTLGRGGCTVTSVGMMFRREMIMSGVSKKYWSVLDEWNLRANSDIWIYLGGLKNSFTYLDMPVKYKRFDSNTTTSGKITKLKSMLETHPEGIVIYGNYGGGYHATLLTDIEDGVFYVVDPVYGRKVKLADSTMYSPSKTQTSKLKYTYSYWYIAK